MFFILGFCSTLLEHFYHSFFFFLSPAFQFSFLFCQKLYFSFHSFSFIPSISSICHFHKFTSFLFCFFPPIFFLPFLTPQNFLFSNFLSFLDFFHPYYSFSFILFLPSRSVLSSFLYLPFFLLFFFTSFPFPLLNPFFPLFSFFSFLF